MKVAVDLTPRQMKTVRSLLGLHLPGVAAWAYGSRVKWTSCPESDLDLVVFTEADHPTSVHTLREAFEESNLPFRVDLFVWDEVPERFRKNIEAEHVVIQEKSRQHSTVAMASETPRDWQVLAIAECMSAIIDYRGKSPRKTTFGIPLITAKIVKGGRIADPSEYIAQEDYDDWMRRGIPKPGDVVMTTEAPLGEVAQLDTRKVALAQRLITLRGDESILDNTFLKFAMQSASVQDQLRARATGTTVLGIRQSELRKIDLPIPPLSEQRAIAEILGSLDDKIELYRRMNRTLEQMAAAIFKAWFVDFEPVRAKADGAKSFPSMPQKVFDALPTEFTDFPLGPIPKGWNVRPIADLARFVNGRAFTKHANGQGRMIIRIAELNSGPGGSTKYGEMEVDEENTAYPDDILFPWSGSLGIYRWHRSEAIINQHIFKVIPEGYPNWFVFFALLDALPFFRMVAAGKATTMGHIQRHHLSDAKLAVAPDDLVEAAGVFIDPLYAMIHANEMQSGTLAVIRDALLPKLLSGEVRVGEAGRIAEEVA